MGVLLPVGYGNITFHFTLAGVTKDLTTSFGYNPDGALDPSVHAQEISDIMSAAGCPFHADAMISDFHYTGTSVTEEDDTGPLLGEFHTSIVGTRSAGALPPNVTLLLAKNTASGGRKNRGRSFLPTIHFDETLVSTAGILESTGLALFQGKWNTAMAAWISSDVPPVLLHSAVGTPTPITGVTMENLVATQRRRLR